MKVVIRTDSSRQIGSGHLMRCLTLAGMLRNEGAEITFICRAHEGHFASLVKENGFTLFLLPEPNAGFAESVDDNQYARWLGATWEEDVSQMSELFGEIGKSDWLIVDHYSLDKKWESALRPFARQIMVIDDLANRPHDCDLLLDQNLYENLGARYEGLVPGHCNLLLGPQYALLREEFYKEKQSITTRTGEVKRILVFFGGADITNETSKALQALRGLNRGDIKVDVIVGSANRFKVDIVNLAETMPNVKVYNQVNNMAKLMAKADLAIGGGGTTTWERCFLGLPTLAIILADNQKEMIETAHNRGALINLGWHSNVTEQNIQDSLEKMMGSKNIAQQLCEKSMHIMTECQIGLRHPVLTEICQRDEQGHMQETSTGIEELV